MASQLFALLTSTRWDPLLENLKWNNDLNNTPSPFLLLGYHLDRLLVAARLHHWETAAKTLSYESIRSECLRAVEEHPPGEEGSRTAFKIRLILTESGELTATASPAKPFTSDPTSASFFKPDTDYHSLYGSPLRIHIDSQPTPISIFTSTKTTNRVMYDEARTRASVPPLSATPSADTTLPADVLLYNPLNQISETTIYNVAFYRSKRWQTPPVSTGCLPGVLRRWLLEQGRIYEADENLLTRESIQEGECVLLFNGVQGCRLGRLALPTPSGSNEQ